MITHTPPTPVNAFLLHALYTQGKQPQWLCWIVAHISDATQAQAGSGIGAGVRYLYLRRHDQRAHTHWELHVKGVISALPKGKAFDAPDWTDGSVRLWECPASDDLPAPAAPPAPPSKHVPRYGHRHEEERLKRG